MTRNNFYPVVHVKDSAHAIRNILVALENEADGVFLINMGDTTPEILNSVYTHIFTCYNSLDFKVGINYLTELNKIPFAIPHGCAIWSDTLNNSKEFIEWMSPFITLFAPYQFKYQPKLRCFNKLN